ncbi:sensor histidine kinase [Streptomyces sp. YKOK-I1]
MSHLRAPVARADRREGGRHGRPVAPRTAPVPAETHLRPQLLRLAVLPPTAVALSACAVVLFTVRSTGTRPGPVLWAVLAGAVAVTGVGILVAAVAADRAARSVGDRVAALRRSSARGEADLRALVESLRRGEAPERRKSRGGPPGDADDFELLAADLARAHSGAVTAVVQASRLSSQAGSEQKLEVFVNLARRLQSLVHREISILDELENEIEDPELLKGLFHVDHLATRIRRHAENLAVLGGAVSRRQWSNPVSMTEVLRSAIAEVEQYSRVKLVPPIDGELRGHAVADVIHLLAELVENATVFSAPHTQVLLRATLCTSGLAVEVEDRGLGLPVEEQARMNALLADPDQVNVGRLLADGRIGLYVVSQLARRHGIRVRLQSNIYGGVQAVLVVPQALLGGAAGAVVPARDPLAPDPAPTPAPDHRQAAAPTTAAPAAIATPSRQLPRQGTDTGRRPAGPGAGAVPRQGEDTGGWERLPVPPGPRHPGGTGRPPVPPRQQSTRGTQRLPVPPPPQNTAATTSHPLTAPPPQNTRDTDGSRVPTRRHGGTGGGASTTSPHPGSVTGAPRPTEPVSLTPTGEGTPSVTGVGEAALTSSSEAAPDHGRDSGSPGGPGPLPVRGERHDRPNPAEAVPGIRRADRRVVEENAGIAPVPRSGAVRGTMGKPRLPRRRAQEHIVPQLRGGPVPRPDAEQPAGHDPGLMAAFQRGIGLAEAQQSLESEVLESAVPLPEWEPLERSAYPAPGPFDRPRTPPPAAAAPDRPTAPPHGSAAWTPATAPDPSATGIPASAPDRSAASPRQTAAGVPATAPESPRVAPPVGPVAFPVAAPDGSAVSPHGAAAGVPATAPESPRVAPPVGPVAFPVAAPDGSAVSPRQTAAGVPVSAPDRSAVSPHRTAVPESPRVAAAVPVTPPAAPPRIADVSFVHASGDPRAYGVRDGTAGAAQVSDHGSDHPTPRHDGSASAG